LIPGNHGWSFAKQNSEANAPTARWPAPCAPPRAGPRHVAALQMSRRPRAAERRAYALGILEGRPLFCRKNFWAGPSSRPKVLGWRIPSFRAGKKKGGRALLFPRLTAPLFCFGGILREATRGLDKCVLTPYSRKMKRRASKKIPSLSPLGAVLAHTHTHTHTHTHKFAPERPLG